MKKIKTNSGISLIELMVALSLFIVVMLISTGALLSIVDANRKARAMESIMDNLAFAIENMSKSIRTGTVYHCGSGGSVPYTSPKSCNNAKNFFTFKDSKGKQVVFKLTGNQIERSTDGGSNYFGITSPEISIDGLQFYVTGTGLTDKKQPKVIMVIRGQAGAKAKEISRFEIQTTISQRAIDG
jgi:type II secretory pathway pseudopilin PulG